ncbi:hypothetical protein Efla_005760 [Eimeria flavescens]
MGYIKLAAGGISRLRKLSVVVMGLCGLALRGAVADLPIHVTINDVKGSWTFYLTPAVRGAVNTCGSGAPNRNTENLSSSVADQQEYLKRHGGVEGSLALKLSDETVPFSQVRDITGNSHRGIWKTLAVRDAKTNELLGGWTTVYDEGFEVRLRDKTRLMAFMKYTKNDACPEAHDGDLEDSNGRTACYETDASKTQLGWYTTIGEDGSEKSGCFYAEKTGGVSQVAAAASLVYVRQRTADGSVSADPLQSGGSGLSYYLSKEFVDKHNQSPISSWRATYNPAFIEQHRTVLSSLIKDFGYSKFSSGGGYGAVPSFLQSQGASQGTVSSQLYACPCKAGESVQDTRAADNDKEPSAVLSPVSMLQSTTTEVSVQSHAHGPSLRSAGGAANLSALEEAAGSGGLPKAFAWPNPFTDPTFKEHTTNQGGCGSCYAIAAVYALERRFNIAASRLMGQDVSVFSGLQTQQQQTAQALLEEALKHRLSPQSVLSCSFYNQGCNGGFPYLVGKHAAELGVVEEGCMPYAASDELTCPSVHKEAASAADASSGAFLTTTSETGSCHAGERRWFAKDYGYVGGCYECGDCLGEEHIKAEILANGPVTAAFDAPASLFSYKSGVYDTDGAPHARVCDTPGAGGSPSGLNGWEFTNHAVNIVGWGETEATEASPPQKYWIVRNTWGSNWGNNGYFLLARGRNAGGIESQVSYIDPDFSRGMGRSLLEFIIARNAEQSNEA